MDRREALWSLYEQQRAGMFAYAVSLTRSVALAEDAVHNAIAATANTNGAVRRLKAYVFRAIRNECLRLMAQRQRAGTLDDTLAARYLVCAEETNPAVQAMAREQVERLQQALKALPRIQREVILLRTYSGLKFREIAAALEKPLPTVAGQYRRGLGRLADILEEKNDEA
jgi:RNA polymerase sigma-70 factor (ECF subfamily)